MFKNLICSELLQTKYFSSFLFILKYKACFHSLLVITCWLSIFQLQLKIIFCFNGSLLMLIYKMIRSILRLLQFDYRTQKVLYIFRWLWYSSDTKSVHCKTAIIQKLVFFEEWFSNGPVFITDHLKTEKYKMMAKIMLA